LEKVRRPKRYRRRCEGQDYDYPFRDCTSRAITRAKNSPSRSNQASRFSTCQGTRETIALGISHRLADALAPISSKCTRQMYDTCRAAFSIAKDSTREPMRKRSMRIDPWRYVALVAKVQISTPLCSGEHHRVRPFAITRTESRFQQCSAKRCWALIHRA